jgi:hypothetical protein
MVSGEREFMVLDGGFSFDYLVLDEVHTLNGPEGDALQRIIKSLTCPVLALSATIGNARQLQKWFQSIGDEREVRMKKLLRERRRSGGERETLHITDASPFATRLGRRSSASSPPIRLPKTTKTRLCSSSTLPASLTFSAS